MTTTLRGLKAAWTTKSEDVNVSTTFSMDVATVSATRQTVTITIGGSTRCFVHYWLVDSLSDYNARTLTPPSGDSQVEWWAVTDATGVKVHTIDNTTASKTWYMVCEWGGRVAVSAAITF